MEQKIIHNINPIIDKSSCILILGSFPSVTSREDNFFYANHSNRFWKVLSQLFDCDFFHGTNKEKEQLLRKNKIALYDVVYSCSIKNSDDSKIKNVVPTNIAQLIENSNIKKIFLNGSKAYELFLKYNPSLVSMAYKLPSTSSANAKYSLDKLVEEFLIIKQFL